MMGASRSASMAAVSALPLPEPLGNQGWPLSAATGKSSDAPQAPKRPRFLRTHDKHRQGLLHRGVAIPPYHASCREANGLPTFINFLHLFSSSPLTTTTLWLSIDEPSTEQGDLSVRHSLSRGTLVTSSLWPSLVGARS